MKYLFPILFALLMLSPHKLVAQRQARPQQTEAPTLAQGEPVTIGTAFQMDSKHLDEERPFSIYLPPSYDAATTRYPVVYVLDGEAYFLHAANTVRSLSQLKLMPEAIVVAIHNTHRRLDMTPPSISFPDVPIGGADRFLAFLAEELIPLIEARYRTLPLRVLIGHSHGGLFNSYALIERPEVFRWHLAIDAPVYLKSGEMERQVEAFLSEHPDHIGRLVTVWSSYEWSEASWQRLIAQAPSGFTATSFKLPEETHESLYFVGMYEGLKKLFFDSVYDYRKVMTLAELEFKYETLSGQYGYPVPIPRNALLDFAQENLFVGQPERARPLLEKALEVYGPSSKTKQYEAWLLRLMENPLEETTETLLQSPLPSPEDTAPFLGIWEGNIGGDIRVEVFFELKDGKVTGRTLQLFPNGSTGTFEHVMTRVLADGTLEWGYMNKTRPYSLLLAYSGRLEGKNILRGAGMDTMSFPPGWPAEAMRREVVLSRKKEN